ncbi:hypothetical protein BDZ91DRAFT_726171 [Kalaharituber pfeilii]|nr:hypothetical protein BDZ91DRAFT_726171 [Kalaharituber pfeilii]
MSTTQLQYIRPGNILWLSAAAIIPGIAEEKLNHPVVVISDVVKSNVDVCMITSLGNQSLETKFRDPRLREKYVQLGLPEYIDSMYYYGGFSAAAASATDLIQVIKVKVQLIRGDNPLPKQSYINVGEPFRVPATSLEELKWGRAEACLQAADLITVRNEVKRLAPRYRLLVKPTAILGYERSGLGYSTYGSSSRFGRDGETYLESVRRRGYTEYSNPVRRSKLGNAAYGSSPYASFAYNSRVPEYAYGRESLSSYPRTVGSSNYEASSISHTATCKPDEPSTLFSWSTAFFAIQMLIAYYFLKLCFRYIWWLIIISFVIAFICSGSDDLHDTCERCVELAGSFLREVYANVVHIFNL